jgi:hypothetical protein
MEIGTRGMNPFLFAGDHCLRGIQLCLFGISTVRIPQRGAILPGGSRIEVGQALQ